MKNEASWDRIVRVVAGVGLVGFGIGVFASPWSWLAAVVGAVLLVTGIVGVCPLYAMLHLRTNGGETSS
ncbi:MAG TPA: DUF2892 domain-containing protein [Acidimicrobiia bacterium]|nr:DUF2892 domain-containing protein [Acidimicrobiia bacterium]